MDRIESDHFLNLVHPVNPVKKTSADLLYETSQILLPVCDANL